MLPTKWKLSEGPEPNTLLIKGLTGGNGETIIELSEDPTKPTITYRSEEFGAVLYVDSGDGDTDTDNGDSDNGDTTNQ